MQQGSGHTEQKGIHKSQRVLQKAEARVEEVINNVSDGSVEETAILTGLAAITLVQKSVETLVPESMRLPCELENLEGICPSKVRSIRKAIEAGCVEIIETTGTDGKEKAYLIARLAENFAQKVVVAISSGFSERDSRPDKVNF